MILNDPITTLSGVGPAQAKKLAKLGIVYIRDLLHHFPHRYDDFSHITPINALRPGESFVVKAIIISKNFRRIFHKHTSVLEAIISDATGSAAVVWFNQPFLDTSLKAGSEYLFAGEVKFYKSLQFQNPVWELAKTETVHVGRIVPVYPLTQGIYPKWFRSLLKRVLDALPKLVDPLPAELYQKFSLSDYDSAIRAVHFPKSLADTTNVRRRLAFDELLLYELRIMAQKHALRTHMAFPIPFDELKTKLCVNELPFPLTKSQRRAAWDIIKDLGRSTPTNRMLVGDVGSGKTIVAALATLQAVSSGKQVAIMVPTDILARQHFETFTRVPVVNHFAVGLLTSDASVIGRSIAREKMNKKELTKKIEKGDIPLLIGTHAVIQDTVKFKNLVLAVVDEQHRFGVQQRSLLSSNQAGLVPHFLSMTATPIPRTLALTLYGDLDISKLTELPSGRKQVTTNLVGRNERENVYRQIDRQISSGRQVFVVCPLIEPSDKLGVKSATEEYQRLRRDVFPARKIGLLHGKLRPKEKQQTIADFAAQKLNILVSTTVVEVGVDFPNATIMILEGAERFGLAQLHQLRGRVGRSSFQSFCYLIPTELSDVSRKRLSAMEQIHDGFELAELDLKLRGPGELYGRLQSGYPQFKIADVFDTELLEQARVLADEILINGLDRYPVLKARLEEIRQNIHPE